MFVKVALLRLFELFVLFMECLQVDPIWHQQLVGLWDRCLNPSSHAQLCRTEVTPWQRCCTIAQQSQIGIIWPLRTVWTVHTTWPLLWGNLGLFVTWLNSYDFANHANSCDEYWGALSPRTVSGIPCWENTDLSAQITATDVVLVSFVTSGYLKK